MLCYRSWTLCQGLLECCACGPNWSGCWSSKNQGQGVQQQAQQPVQQSTQYRVARTAGDSFDSSPHVFDLRSVPTSPSQCVIGGDDSGFSAGHVHAVVGAIPDGSDDMQSILLDTDSGADATVMPLRYAQAGASSTAAKLKLHDAQGREIPVVAMGDVEMSLLDQHGRLVNVNMDLFLHRFINPSSVLGSFCNHVGVYVALSNH